MQTRTRVAAAAATAAAALVAGGTVAASGSASAQHAVRLKLTPSSPQLAACMPRAKVTVTVALTTDRVGFDVFRVRAAGLPPKRAFTVFLLEKAGSPVGAAEYIGDLTSDRHGQADNTFRLIVAEAFSSTLVNTATPTPT